MTSVVIAAHNEEAVIGRTLDALLADARPGELDVTVVANGCSDDTAAVAGRRAGVRVLEVPKPSKPSALNAAHEAVEEAPVVYLDADIPVRAQDVRALVEALEGHPQALAAFPDRHVDTTGCSLPVRAYFAVNTRLPVFRHGLFGRGMIVLSGPGRARFDRFPEMVADDLFLDSLFTGSEKLCVTSVTTTVVAPTRTRDLVRRLERVRRGNAAMREATRAPEGQPVAEVGAVRAPDRWSWLRDVVVRRPWLAPAGVVYVAITLWAAALARRGDRRAMTWGHDRSSRSRVGTAGGERETR